MMTMESNRTGIYVYNSICLRTVFQSLVLVFSPGFCFSSKSVKSHEPHVTQGLCEVCLAVAQTGTKESCCVSHAVWLLFIYFSLTRTQSNLFWFFSPRTHNWQGSQLISMAALWNAAVRLSLAQHFVAGFSRLSWYCVSALRQGKSR